MVSDTVAMTEATLEDGLQEGDDVAETRMKVKSHARVGVHTMPETSDMKTGCWQHGQGRP